jgi:hypothetical protein
MQVELLSQLSNWPTKILGGSIFDSQIANAATDDSILTYIKIVAKHDANLNHQSILGCVTVICPMTAEHTCPSVTVCPSDDPCLKKSQGINSDNHHFSKVNRRKTYSNSMKGINRMWPIALR